MLNKNKIFKFTLSLVLLVIFSPVEATYVNVANAAKPLSGGCTFSWSVRNPDKQRLVKNGRISVKANNSCIIRHLGPTGTRWRYHSLSIAQQPQNGKLTVIGRLGLKFSPNIGFKGRDKGAFKVTVIEVATGEFHSIVVETKIKVR